MLCRLLYGMHLLREVPWKCKKQSCNLRKYTIWKLVKLAYDNRQMSRVEYYNNNDLEISQDLCMQICLFSKQEMS